MIVHCAWLKSYTILDYSTYTVLLIFPFLQTNKLIIGNWRGVINKDLKKIGSGWDEVQEAAEDRRSWWIHVAQCIFDTG